ncbi:MAG: hypothetical protein H7Y01_13510 [Ferruginibacter sp.]|nr:hypothetical protein [Chitinophagaceae bacterium]
MKKILIVLLFGISTTSFGQQTNPSQPVTREDYLIKSEKQKTNGWVLLAGGTGLIGAGLLIGNSKKSSFDDASFGVVLGGIGFLSVLGSIPAFIASGKTKRKGMSLSFKNETTSQIQKNGFVLRPVPSLRLKISL